MGPRLCLSVFVLGLLFAVSGPAKAQFWVGPSPGCQSDCRESPQPPKTDGDFRLFTLNEALLRISADQPFARRRSILAEEAAPALESVRFSRDRSWPDGAVVVPRNMVQASYDKPVPGSGLTILGGSAFNDKPAAHHADNWSNAARTNLGFSFSDYGIRLTVNPDVEANWGAQVTGRTHYGITNQLDTDIFKDVTLSLYSRYDGYSFSENWRDYDELRRFATLSYQLGDGYVVSIAAREISGTNNWENWSLTGPGMKFTLPVAARLALTLDNELLYSRRDFHDDRQVPTGYHRNHNLQASWSPAAFAKYALNIIMGYTLHYDSAAEQQFAYHNIVRFGATARF